MASKHWIGTVPADHPDARFWTNPITLEHIAYLKGQEEQGKGENGYRHYQIYLVLKDRKRVSWLKKHIHPTAHWEKKRGTVAEAIDYVSKQETRVQDGEQIEIGTRPKEQTDEASETRKLNRIREKDEVQKQAQDILEKLNDGEFVAWQDIPADIQMKPGFQSAYKMATKDMVGPERPDLKIITLIGPPGCGKSYAIAKLFPKAAKWLKGNSGDWFCNAKSDTLVFEEFSGQVPLQNMLKYLDPYPLALEVKGGTEPAMYRLVIITSNTDPGDWYTTAEEFKVNPSDPMSVSTAKKRRIDALAALHDRLGYKPLTRTNGTCYIYTLDESLGPAAIQIKSIRDEIMQILSQAKDAMKKPMPTEDEEILSMPSSQDPMATIPDIEHENLDETDPLIDAAAAADTSSDEEH